MSAKLTPAGVIGKWVIVPALVLIFGYYVVGPRAGKAVLGPSKSDQAVANEPPNADPTPVNPSVAAEQKPSGPDIDVSVHKVKPGSTEVAATSPKPARKRHKKTAPKDPESPAPADQKKPDSTVPPPDQGGSAGSTTAG